MIGAWVFPTEAKANPGIFKISGNPATLGETSDARDSGRVLTRLSAYVAQ